MASPSQGFPYVVSALCFLNLSYVHSEKTTYGKVASDILGGDPVDYAPSDDLHNLSWGIMNGQTDKRQYLTVAIRLFANLGGPVYFVIVGEPTPERS